MILAEGNSMQDNQETNDCLVPFVTDDGSSDPLLRSMQEESGMSMSTSYTHILDLAREAEPPADGILSRTIFQDDQVKA